MFTPGPTAHEQKEHVIQLLDAVGSGSPDELTPRLTPDCTVLVHGTTRASGEWNSAAAFAASIAGAPWRQTTGRIIDILAMDDGGTFVRWIENVTVSGKLVGEFEACAKFWFDGDRARRIEKIYADTFVLRGVLEAAA